MSKKWHAITKGDPRTYGPVNENMLLYWVGEYGPLMRAGFRNEEKDDFWFLHGGGSIGGREEYFPTHWRLFPKGPCK